MKLLYRSSYSLLDGFCRTTYRIRIFGITILKWKTVHRNRPSDWY